MGALVKCMCFASTSIESSESTCLLDESLPGSSSECSTPKNLKLLKGVARLRTSIVNLILLNIASFSQVPAPSQIRQSILHDEHMYVSADESNTVNTLDCICVKKDTIILFKMPFQIVSA